ncbi:MAG: helix-turn-helix domain-containing protein [Rhodospirillales bacterium]|jgi:hypothetical protein|nr:helix-turn-helix domain-containing protein [Rhodospirillales bacterium]
MNEIAQPKVPSIDLVQRVTAQVFEIPAHEMKSARRMRRFARPRQVAMFLARELTPKSLPEIGRAFGGRDHTTVMHAIETVGELLARDPDLRRLVDRVRSYVPTAPDDAVDYERLLAERDAEIADLRARIAGRADQVSDLQAKLLAKRAEVVELQNRVAALERRQRRCLKCHRPIDGDYPGLCESCRGTNRGVSPMAEGVVG